jgi:hypothetical protein
MIHAIEDSEISCLIRCILFHLMKFMLGKLYEIILTADQKLAKKRQRNENLSRPLVDYINPYMPSCTTQTHTDIQIDR